MMYGFSRDHFPGGDLSAFQGHHRKNAQSISMTKILGYTNGEISCLYILSTSLVVVFCLLLSLTVERQIMEDAVPRDDAFQYFGMDHHVGGSHDLCENDSDRNRDLCSGSSAGIPEDPSCAHG